MIGRPYILAVFLVLSMMDVAFADDKQDNDVPEKQESAAAKQKSGKQSKAEKVEKSELDGVTLVDLAKKPEYKATWASIFKGEYSPPKWVDELDALSAPVVEITDNEGKTYIVGSMCKSGDCISDRLVAAFSSDRKKAWGLGITLPAGLGKEGTAHPKQYATLRWYNKPEQNVRKVIMGYVEKDPGWK